MRFARGNEREAHKSGKKRMWSVFTELGCVVLCEWRNIDVVAKYIQGTRCLNLAAEYEMSSRSVISNVLKDLVHCDYVFVVTSDIRVMRSACKCIGRGLPLEIQNRISLTTLDLFTPAFINCELSHVLWKEA